MLYRKYFVYNINFPYYKMKHVLNLSLDVKISHNLTDGRAFFLLTFIQFFIIIIIWWSYLRFITRLFISIWIDRRIYRLHRISRVFTYFIIVWELNWWLFRRMFWYITWIIITWTILDVRSTFIRIRIIFICTKALIRRRRIRNIIIIRIWLIIQTLSSKSSLTSSKALISIISTIVWMIISSELLFKMLW